MDIALLVYDEMALLDAAGPYEVMRNVPGWKVSLVGERRGEVRSEGGAGVVAERTLGETERADIVIVPGGYGSRALMRDETLLEWLREIDGTTRWTTSVCTGSLILGAAGLLDGKRATTNWLQLELLGELGAEPVAGRFVEEDKLITAAGVTAGIDMAIHLVAREAGPEVAQAIQLGIEYDPDPPFDCGSPEKAPAAIVEAVSAAAR